MSYIVANLFTLLISGLGQTINDTTGTKAVGDGLQGLTDGIESGAHSVGKGAENAGEWKKP